MTTVSRPTTARLSVRPKPTPINREQIRQYAKLLDPVHELPIKKESIIPLGLAIAGTAVAIATWVLPDLP
jgi:hypothetical protein